MMTGAVAQPSNVPPGSRDAAGNLVGVTTLHLHSNYLHLHHLKHLHLM